MKRTILINTPVMFGESDVIMALQMQPGVSTGDLSYIGLAESKWGYSNVSTGEGVVAAQSSSKHTIDLKKYLKITLNNK